MYPVGRLSQPPLLAYRYLSGYGQERGGISCLLRNNLQQPLRVIYTETIPWYMRLYLHTLNIQAGANALEPGRSCTFRTGSKIIGECMLRSSLHLIGNTFARYIYPFRESSLHFSVYNSCFYSEYQLFEYHVYFINCSDHAIEQYNF